MLWIVSGLLRSSGFQLLHGTSDLEADPQAKPPGKAFVIAICGFTQIRSEMRTGKHLL